MASKVLGVPKTLSYFPKNKIFKTETYYLFIGICKLFRKMSFRQSENVIVL